MNEGVRIKPQKIHESIWEAIDRIVTTEFRTADQAPGTGIFLYEAARKITREPISFTAAQRLVEVLSPGAPVVLTTGAGGPPWLFKGETDGPPGLAVIARVLSLGFGVWPIVISEERSRAPLTATLEAAGISVLPESLARLRPTTATMVPFTTDPAVAEMEAKAFLNRYQPAALIVTEKTSPNRAGVIHSTNGKNWPPEVDFTRVDFLVNECRKRGIFSIGIGDRGNEIGFGLIEDTVRNIMPWANVCQCPCGQGMASAIAVDVLYPVNISNWGCYALAAALAMLKGQADFLHDPDMEMAMLRACVAAGAVDGTSARQVLAVDGTSAGAQVAIVTLHAELVRKVVNPSQKVSY